MARQSGNRNGVLSPPTRRKYRWHHIVVSTLCICALVAVVSSLFTTFENIHNMKRKKKRSIVVPDNTTSITSNAVPESSGSGSGSGSGASSIINVMEINRSNVPKPLQQMNATTTSWGIATGGTVRNASAAISASLALNATKAEAASDDEEDIESDFESASDVDNSDDGGGGSGQAADQVDSIDANTATPTGSSTSLNLAVEAKVSNASTYSSVPGPSNSTGDSTTASSGDEMIDMEDDDEDDEDDQDDDSQSSPTTSSDISVKTGPIKEDSKTSSNSTSSLVQTLQNSQSIPDSPFHLQPHKLPKLGNATITLKNSNTNFNKVSVGGVGADSVSKTSFQWTHAKNTVPFIAVNYTTATVSGQTKNISSSLDQPAVTVPTGTTQFSDVESPVRNIKEEHKETTPTSSSNSQSSQSGSSSGGDDHPSFPSSYHATGIIILPESKIAEPFEIWYAPDHKKSRIDYYYGEFF